MIDSPILTTLRSKVHAISGSRDVTSALSFAWLNWNQFSQFLISSRSIRTFKRLRQSLNQLKLVDRWLGERRFSEVVSNLASHPISLLVIKQAFIIKQTKTPPSRLLNRTFHSVSSTKETKIKEKKYIKIEKTLSSDFSLPSDCAALGSSSLPSSEPKIYSRV